MVLGFEKAFACFLFRLPHSPAADLKFGAKFSHDNATKDSLGISTMLSSTPLEYLHPGLLFLLNGVIYPMHQASQRPSAGLRGFQPQSTTPSPLFPNCL